MSESKASAQQGGEPPAVRPPGVGGGPPTEPDPAVNPSQQAPTTEPSLIKNLTKLMNLFTSNPEYNIINLPDLLNTNLTVTCIKTLPNVSSARIELTTIDCDEIYIFSKLNSGQIKINLELNQHNQALLPLNMNLYHKVKFLPQLLKNISKSDEFYCMEWGRNNQFKFDLDLFNCDKFSVLFSPK